MFGRDGIWKGVGYRRRRRIVAAARNGEALTDPADATLAVLYARRVLAALARSQTGVRRGLRLLVFVYPAVELVVAIKAHRPYALPGALGVAGVFAVLADVYALGTRKRVAANLATSERLNIQVLEALGALVLPPQTERADARTRHPAAVSAMLTGASFVLITAAIAILPYDHSPSTPVLVLYIVLALASILSAAGGLFYGYKAWRWSRTRVGKAAATLGLLLSLVLGVMELVAAPFFPSAY